MACLLAGMALLAPLAWNPTVRVVYNRSDSVPRGWYCVIPAFKLSPGNHVLVRLPAEVAVFAAQRGYLPNAVPLLKRVAAIAPQSVCVQRQTVAIDGVVIARVLEADARGRELSAWRGCRLLQGDEVFLLGTSHLASFDSRYFGPVSTATVVGLALPLWVWESP